MPIEITTPFKRYPSVNRCIYCDKWHSKLSREHIIPFGLADDSLVMGKASCPGCQNKTREFETKCLKWMWLPFRTRIGAPSRGQDTHSEFLLRRISITDFQRDGRISYEKTGIDALPVTEYPLVYIAYKFDIPAILNGRPAAEDDYDLFGLFNDQEIKKYIQNDKQGFRLAPGIWQAFCALLAKIAHAYGVAELGMKAFRPGLTWFIRGANLRIFEWIGGQLEVPPASTALHEIRLRMETANGRRYAVVDLRLFACLGTPQYTIVLGELEHSFNQFSLLQKPLYAVEIKTPIPTGELIPRIQSNVGRAWS